MAQEPKQLDLFDWKPEKVKLSRFREILKSKYLWIHLVLVAVFSVLIVVVWLNFNLLVGLVVHEKLKDLMLDYWIFIFAFWAIILTLIIWLVPIWQVKPLKWKEGNQDQSEFDLEKERIKLRDDIRKTLAQIIGGAFLLLGLFATYNTFELNRQGQELTREGQVTERFSKAVALLKEPDVSVRLGGLYALERVAKDSPKDHSTVIEILAAFIREKSKEQIDKSLREKNQFPQDWEPSPTDVTAAAVIIHRRFIENDKEGFILDLDQANLHQINLDNGKFNSANLKSARFYQASLKGANLNSANLGWAKLMGANLSNADLRNAKINSAVLSSAKLNDANLSNATLTFADLKGAKLKGAKLQNSDLTYADLSTADLTEADFTGAILYCTTLPENLRDSKGLTFDNLSQAIIYERTILPEYLENRKNELLELTKVNAAIKEKSPHMVMPKSN